MKQTRDGLSVRCPERRARPHCLGLMFPAIKHASLPEIMVESDGSLATDDLIEGETKRRGLAATY